MMYAAIYLFSSKHKKWKDNHNEGLWTAPHGKQKKGKIKYYYSFKNISIYAG